MILCNPLRSKISGLIVDYLIRCFTFFGACKYALVLAAVLAPLTAHSQNKVGVELEFAATPKAANMAADEAKVHLLSSIWTYFGKQGDFKFLSWNKYSNAMGTNYVAMTDGEGRKWQVVPELMERGFDGFELITPPLDWEEDRQALKFALQKIEKEGLFAEGYSSSTHFTFDVSHLLSDKRNVSKLVDLILFIEQHQTEIYSALAPKRYGTVINGYAVPLAVNQQELLTELAALPRDQRSFDQVKAIFHKYSEKEIALVGGAKTQAWKYRSVNYGKLFGLGQFKNKTIPAIEFRISDLVTSQSLEKTLRLFQSIVAHGTDTSISEFKSGFPSGENRLDAIPGLPTQRHLTRFIEQVTPETYKDFLGKVHLSEKDYPQRIGPPAVMCRAVFVN